MDSPTLPIQPKRGWRWNATLSFLAPAAGAVIVLAVEKFFGLGIMGGLETNHIQATVILGLAIIFGALLIGYFVVLREALVDRGRLLANTRADAIEAEQQQQYVRELLKELETQEKGTPAVAAPGNR